MHNFLFCLNIKLKYKVKNNIIDSLINQLMFKKS